VVHLGCDFERNSQRPRNRDGAVRAFLRRDPAEKGKIAAVSLSSRAMQLTGMPWRTVPAKLMFGTGPRWAFEIETSGMSLNPA
jgi:hypothetical protein